MLHRALVVLLTPPQDLDIAGKIQNLIIPKKVFHKEDIAIEQVYQSMNQVGGDFFDIMEQRPGYYRIFIADAVGHGVRAALITMIIKAVYESLKNATVGTAKILEILNKKIMHDYPISYAIFPCAILDIDMNHKKLYYSAAGFIDQIIFSGESIIRLPKTGRIIGANEKSDYRVLEYDIPVGSKILLFTDGIQEQINESENEFGLDKIIEIVKSNLSVDLDQRLKVLTSKVKEHSGKVDIQDDITIIGIDIK